MEIKNSVAVVTGGASGLGEATVRELLGQGAKVAIFDMNVEQGEQLVAELGEDVIFCKMDVADESNVQTGIDAAMKAFGAIHIAINCAGVGDSYKVVNREGKPFPMDKFKWIVDINLIGTMNVIRLSAIEMLKNKPNEDGEIGVMINTASIAAMEGQIGQAAYTASKAGVIGMTLPIAREFATYGIRINTLIPGLFMTPMLMGASDKLLNALKQMTLFPKRLGKPVEFAMTARHLIENPIINGESIRLDTGMRMHAK